MKKLLRILAIVYLFFGVIAFLPAILVIVGLLRSHFSADSLLTGVLLLVFMPVPLIIINCSRGYLKFKDVKSASNISVLTGVFVWFLFGAVFSLRSGPAGSWRDLIFMILNIALGVYAHKLFQKYINIHYGVKPQSEIPRPADDVDADLKKKVNDGLL